MPTGFIQFIWISNGIHEKNENMNFLGKIDFYTLHFQKK